MGDRVFPGAHPLAGTRFLAGSGRSGTTWIQDALAEANHLRPVFEPLHPRVSQVGARFAHRALGPEEAHSELEQFLAEVCDGKRNRFWTQYRCQRNFIVPNRAELASYAGLVGVAHRWRKFLTEIPGHARATFRREPLVKCIWSNLMLGWLSRTCGFRIVLIVRHPAAVVESKLRNAWNVRSTLDRLRSDRRLHELTAGRYRSILERTLEPVEELTALWLIENQWAMETARRHGLTVVFYEHLKAPGTSAWDETCEALNLPHRPSPAALARPSQQSALQGSEADREIAAPPKWQYVLGRDDRSRLQAMLDETGFSHYSVEDAMPRPGHASDIRDTGTAGKVAS